MMAESHARSCPPGSSSGRSPPPRASPGRRARARTRWPRAISTTAGRSKSVAESAGSALRNAIVYVPGPPPTSRSRLAPPTPTAATIRSARGEATTCIAPMNARSDSSGRAVGERRPARPPCQLRPAIPESRRVKEHRKDRVGRVGGERGRLRGGAVPVPGLREQLHRREGIEDHRQRPEVGAAPGGDLEGREGLARQEREEVELGPGQEHPALLESAGEGEE